MQSNAVVSIAVCAWCLGGCDEVQPLGHADAGLPPAESWRPIAAPAVNYYGVHGSSAQDVWIVGAGGTILHWDGMALRPVPSGAQSDLYAVFAVSATLAYAAGASGLLLVWNGTTWVKATTPTMQDLYAIWADATTAFVVGQTGTILTPRGGTWSLVPALIPNGDPSMPPTAIIDHFYAVTNTGSSVLAFGTNGTVCQYGGTDCTHLAIPGFFKTLAGATTGPGGTYVVGIDGAAFSIAGASFTLVTGFPSGYLRAVTAPGSDVFVVGWDGILARLRAGKVIAYPRDPATWYRGVWAAAKDDVWVVGASSVLRGPPPVDPPSPDGGVLDGGAQ
jgi:hypothetical protein